MTFQLDMQNHSAISMSDFPNSSKIEWLNGAKQEALDVFCKQPLPTRKVEHWKYNELSFLKSEKFSLTEDKNPDPAQSEHSIDFSSALEITFIDGFLKTDLTALSIEEGLTIKTLSDCDETEQEKVRALLSANEKNLLLNLNQILIEDGIYISVDSNKQIQTPIYIKHLSTKGDRAEISSNLVLVNSAKHSELTLVEHFESERSDNIKLALQQTIFSQDVNSIINAYRINFEKDSAVFASQVIAKLSTNATYNAFFVGLGSKLNRTDIDVHHQGQGAHCELNGVYLPANSQTIDYHSNIEHQVAHCTSHEVFRGIMADKSSATFNGKIHIFQDAQKSDAYLNNKNLLLTNEAEINTKPELEIYADDVKCAHGATVAQIDDKSVYYLQTRGIERKKARKMLSVAFIQELVDTIRNEEVKTFVKDNLSQYMSQIDNQ